ncbi:unnamed protein product, partial [Durusdinium trenchii]
KTSLLLISTSLGTDCALSSPGCFRLGRGKMDTRVRRSCWLLLLGLFLHGTGRPFLSLFREERVERSTRELLRREAWAASALSVLGVPSTEVFAEGFDPFGEELKKQAPQDLKTPPEDAQVSPSGLKWKILKAADCATTKCAKPRAFDKVSVAYTGWQPDGNVFDSSRTRGKVQFQVGEVIGRMFEDSGRSLHHMLVCFLSEEASRRPDKVNV